MRLSLLLLCSAVLPACSEGIVALDGAHLRDEAGSEDRFILDGATGGDGGSPACDCIPWSEDFFAPNTCFCFQEQWGCRDRPEIVSFCDINSDCWTLEADVATGCMKPVVRFRGEQDFETCNCRGVDGG